MRIVAIADTHGKHDQLDLPSGDVLVHAGDFTQQGEPEQVRSFVDWLDQQPHEHRMVVAGNHEVCLDPDNPHYDARNKVIEAIEDVGIYLENESAVIDGIHFFGSPNTVSFENWAFEESGEELAVIYEAIPEATDVLVTHMPPWGVRDRVAGSFETRAVEGALINQTHKRVGSEALREAVKRVRPDIHLFGHIHPQYGREKHGETTYCNVALVGERLQIQNDPVVIEL